MSPYLAATAYAWFGHIIGALLAPRVGLLSERALPLFLVAASAAMLFFVPDPLLLLTLFLVLLGIIGPRHPAHRAAFFLTAAASLPYTIASALSIPGIKTLVTLHPYTVASIVLLTPIFFARCRTCSLSPAVRISDVCLALYVALAATAVLINVDFTSALRFSFEQVLALLLPFIALRCAISNTDDVEILLRGFLVASLLLAGVAAVATLKQWDFYRLMDPPTSLRVAEDLRSGFLRIETVANTHSLGSHFATALVLLAAMKDRLNSGWIRLMLIRAALLVGLYVTDSRGALGSLIIGYAVYVFMTTHSAALRWLMLTGTTATIMTGVIYAASIDINSFDPHGTFQYRIDVLTTSSQHIFNHPLLGDLNYANRQMFQPLRQGQGIIDITNLYLLVALNYGIPALILFIATFVLPLTGLLRLGSKRDFMDPKLMSARRLRAALAGAICGWLFLIFTTSDVALTVHIGIVLAAISHALRDAVTRPKPACAKWGPHRIACHGVLGRAGQA